MRLYGEFYVGPLKLEFSYATASLHFHTKLFLLIDYATPFTNGGVQYMCSISDCGSFYPQSQD